VEPTQKAESAFDASLFKFRVWVNDDGKGLGGGTQRASTVLEFVDTRSSWRNPDKWDCRITISMPIRHRTFGVISPERAAEISAAAAVAASTKVMHERPKWIAALFCPKFADQIMKELNSVNLGARVTSP
jgi:hypothetical protein